MRRTNLFFLSAVILFGTLLVGGGGFVAAQDATPEDSMGHPLIGSWMIVDADDPEGVPFFGRFSADGGYAQVDLDGAALGAWEPTGDTTANLTFSFVDDEVGMGTIRASLEVAPDGQTFTASYTLEFADPATGESSGEIGPGTAEGTRMTVEGPGEPAASFEDFFGGFEGTPEATPES